VIRKYARLDARPETVMTIFRDVESWPFWMPTVESVEVLERSGSRNLLEIRERLKGRVMVRRVQVRFDDDGHTETQVSGPVKRWNVVWRFAEPPVGRGTVASTQIDIDLGMMGLLVPKRMLQRTLDEFHEQIVSRAEARARRREAVKETTIWGVEPGQPLSIRVYETPTELEVWFGDRRFVIPAAE